MSNFQGWQVKLLMSDIHFVFSYNYEAALRCLTHDDDIIVDKSTSQVCKNTIQRKYYDIVPKIFSDNSNSHSNMLYLLLVH